MYLTLTMHRSRVAHSIDNARRRSREDLIIMIPSKVSICGDKVTASIIIMVIDARSIHRGELFTLKGGSQRKSSSTSRRLF